MKKLMLGAAALSILAAPAAMANTANIDKKVDEKFSQIDANGDGVVSEAEFATVKDTKFSDADANADGTITKAELKAHMEAKHATKAR